MSDWRAAFERDKHKVGRAIHRAWAAEKIKQGFADHAWGGEGPRTGWVDASGLRACACGKYRDKHRPDMLDFDDLAPHIQEHDIQAGIVGFRMGYEAALAERTP
jgi:hypothetical protein